MVFDFSQISDFPRPLQSEALKNNSHITKGQEVADVRNHLLSFSVLALLNAHCCSALADSTSHEPRQTLTLDNLTDNGFSYIYRDFTGDLPEHSHYALNASDNLPSPEWIDVSFFRQSAPEAIVGSDYCVDIQAAEVDAITGWESLGLNQFSSDTVHSFKVSLDVLEGKRPLTDAVAWKILDSTLTDETLPDLIDLKVDVLNPNFSGTAAALQAYNTSIEYSGTLTLSASALNNTDNVFALDIIDSTLTLKSRGNSEILGDIRATGLSEVSIILTHETDYFKGRFENATPEETQMAIRIESGARWKTHGNNFINDFYWGKDGLLDIADAQGSVSIKTVGSDSNHEILQNTTHLEDGALLRVSINDTDLGSDQYKLQLGDVSPVNPEGARVFVEILDNRSEKNTEELNLGLISVTNVDDSHGKFFLEAIPTYYETGLGAYKTYGSIGTDGADGFILTSMVTDRLGPSQLVKNVLDFTAALTVSEEQNADRVFSVITERLSQNTTRGLWVDAQTGETELDLQSRTSLQTLKTHSLTLGFDRDVDLTELKDETLGAWISRNESDADLKAASAEIDSTAVGFYFHGITEDNYRLILQGHYALGEHSIKTPGFFGDNHILGHAKFDSDYRSYGAGLYFGFTYPDIDKRWFFEPFVSGYTYWIDQDACSDFETISFKGEKIHQSWVKIGATTGFRAQGKWPLSVYAQAAWAHRFGQSFDLKGYEGENTEKFKTENLRESWGSLKLSAQYRINEKTLLSTRVSASVSEVVKPKYEWGVNLNYAL